MSQINLYQSDVRKMSDEELKTLSAELAEAYCHPDRCEEGWDDGGEWWSDDAAETRYLEMVDEQRRRNPPPPYDPKGINAITTAALDMLVRNIAASTASLQREYGPKFAKIGNTIEVQRPARYCA